MSSCSVARPGLYTLPVESRTRLLGNAVVPALLLAVLLPLSAGAEPPVILADPDGGPVDFAAWLGGQGRTVVLLWASWLPRAEEVTAELGELRRACSDRRLQLVVVGVQEPLEASRTLLEGSGQAWLHDRHGSLLKRYRVIRLPALLVLEADGKLLAELQASPEAVREWRP